MSPRSLATRQIIDLVRIDQRIITVFADLGISPRYLYWTVENAAADAGVSLDALSARLAASLPKQRFAAPA